MMKNVTLIMCLGTLISAHVMLGVSIGQKIKERAGDVGRTVVDYIPIVGTSSAAFWSAYDQAMEKVYQLRDQEVLLVKEAASENNYTPGYRVKHVNYSIDQKKYAVARIIKLCNDMVDIFTSVTERFGDRVEALRNYIRLEAEKMKALEADAIKNNNFIAIADIAEKLIDHLEKEAKSMAVKLDIDRNTKFQKETSRKEVESRK